MGDIKTNRKINHFTTAAILAGGKSTRMGFDKQFIRIGNQYLIERTVINLKKAFENVIIISNSSEMKRLAASWSVEVYSDIYEDCGPLGGIYTALHYSKDEMTYVTACDMPNVSLEYINALKGLAASRPSDGIVAKLSGYIEPFQSFYSKTLIDVIEKALQNGERGIQKLLRSKDVVFIHEKEIVKICGDLSIFDNVNDMEAHNSVLNLIK